MAHKEHCKSLFFSASNAFMPTLVFFALLNLFTFQRKLGGFACGFVCFCFGFVCFCFVFLQFFSECFVNARSGPIAVKFSFVLQKA